MFLPATHEELQELGWDRLDVILVTGDSDLRSILIAAKPDLLVYGMVEKTVLELAQRSCIAQSETPSAEERSLSSKRPPGGSARKRFLLRKMAFSDMEFPDSIKRPRRRNHG